MMNQRDVLIKWTGSKRQQAQRILSFLPPRIETYYEPFVGGGSVLYNVLRSKISIEKIHCSDLNPDLIGIWDLVKNDPEKIVDLYKTLWPFDGEKYYCLRSEFNKDKDPAKLFCLLRARRNGVVRYNKKGEFTSAFHIKRNGANPDLIEDVVNEWHTLIQRVHFKVCDFEEVKSLNGDVVYADPPYTTSVREFYQGEVDYDRIWKWALGQKGFCLMSTDTEPPQKIPKVELPAGFHRLNRHNKVVQYHSLYLIESNWKDITEAVN